MDCALSESDVFEVSTDSCDPLRARIVVRGDLAASNVSLLISAVRTHLRAGRRYLRVDLAGARTTDGAVLDSLTTLYDFATQAGRMVVFEGVSPDEPLGAHVLGLHTGT